MRSDLIAALQNVVELILGDTEVRCAPDWTPVAEQDRLGRLVPYPQSHRRLVRHVAMALDGDELICSGTLGAFDVRAQLVKRLAADPAAAAVLEQKDRPLARFGDGGFELVDVR